MKAIETATKTIETKWQCEVCGKISISEWEIRLCEKGHKQKKCEHQFKNYELNTEGYTPSINRECENCGFTESRDIYGDNGLLEKIFNLLPPE